jgi:hypothetical protein
MRISAKTSYERYSKTKLPFLTYGEDGTIMNGHWDVTETKEFLEWPGRALKRLFSIPSNQGYTCFERQMCIGKDAALLCHKEGHGIL